MLNNSSYVSIIWVTLQVRLLEQYLSVSRDRSYVLDPILAKDLCNSVVFVCRSNNKTKIASSDAEAKVELLKIADTSKRSDYAQELESFKHVNFTWLKNLSDNLHNKEGILLTEPLKQISQQIKKVIDTMVDDAEILPKIMRDGRMLTIGTMCEFLSKTAGKCRPTNLPKEEIATSQLPLITSPPLSAKLNAKTVTDIDINIDKNGSEEPMEIDQAGLSEQMEVDPVASLATCLDNLTLDDKLPPHHHHEQDKQVFIPLLETDLDQEECNAGRAEENRIAIVLEGTCSAKAASQLLDQKLGECPQKLEKALVKSRTKEELDETERTSDKSKHQTANEIEDTEKIGERNAETTGKSEGAALTASEAERAQTATAVAQEVNDFQKGSKLKERSEKEARDNEEARQILEETFQLATSQMCQMLIPSICHWIEKELNLETANQVETIYLHVLKGVTEEHRHVIHSNLWQEFVQKVDKQCKRECSKPLDIIAEAILKIRSGIRKKFDLNGYLSDSRLKQVVTEEEEKATRKIEDKSAREMVGKAAEKFLNIFAIHNEKIIKLEKQLYLGFIPEITAFYKNEMRAYVKKDVYSTERLQRIHWALVGKLEKAFQMACCLGSSDENRVPQECEILKEELRKEFADIKQENEKNLQTLEQSINKVKKSMRDRYNTMVEEILQKNLDGLDTSGLNKLHDVVKMEIMKLLEIEIRNKVRKEEPLEAHRDALQAHIDAYWPVIIAANQKNQEKAAERKLQEERDRKEQEKAYKLNLKERQDQQRKIKDSASRNEVSDTATTVNVDTSGSKSFVRPESTLRNLEHPLIFHLQSSRVTMATNLDGHTEILKNESGEDFTPAVVVFTPETEFLYGTEALAMLASSEDKTPGATEIFWRLCEFMNDANYFRQPVSINGGVEKITTELLIAFILGKLKGAAEKQLNGRFSKTFIAIPFWLSSVQRVMVKDAAAIAGFSNVTLINESSAAAYNCVLSESRKERINEILVVSEAMGRINAFVYQYNSNEQKVKMLGHEGNYNLVLTEPGLLSRGWKTMKSFWTGSGGYGSLEDHEHSPVCPETSRTIHKACKVAIDNASNELNVWKVEPKERLLISENLSKYRATLEDAISGYGKKAGDIRQHSAVIDGAVALGQRPGMTGKLIRDKLANSVLRSAKGAYYTVISADEYLPVGKGNKTHTLSSGQHSAVIYQSILNNVHEVGVLASEKIYYGLSLEPHFQVNFEGILTLDYVSLYSHTRNELSVFPDTEYSWKICNLPQQDVEHYQNLMFSIVTPRQPAQDSELTIAKQSLLQQCQEMTEKLDNVWNIRSQLVKDKVREQISNGVTFANHEKSSLDDIENRMEAMRKLNDRYDSKLVRAA